LFLSQFPISLCSIAVGNSGVEATGYGLTISGVAPRARLAVYKACWLLEDGSSACEAADIEAAMNQAVADGVDVVSMSLGTAQGAPQLNDYLSQMSHLRAYLAGVVLAMSAGSNGQPPYDETTWQTLQNTSPFALTVGISTVARQQGKLVLPDGSEVRGYSLTDFDLQAPLLLPALAAAGSGTHTGQSTGSDSTGTVAPGSEAAAAEEEEDSDPTQYCVPGSLASLDVEGKIVVCTAGGGVKVEEAVAEVQVSNGAGVVMAGGDDETLPCLMAARPSLFCWCHNSWDTPPPPMDH
ncbi:hypothetical protein CLOM_g11412, partial [Closterium sp. NIES-68]